MAKRKEKKPSKTRGWMEDNPEDWKARAADEFYEMLERGKKEGVIDLRGLEPIEVEHKRAGNLYQAVREAIENAAPPVHLKSFVLIIPKKKTAEGTLVSSTSMM